jgi:hypothetical protein
VIPLGLSDISSISLTAINLFFAYKDNDNTGVTQIIFV